MRPSLASILPYDQFCYLTHFTLRNSLVWILLSPPPPPITECINNCTVTVLKKESIVTSLFFILSSRILKRVLKIATDTIYWKSREGTLSEDLEIERWTRFYEWIACVPTGLLAENGSQDVVEHENVSQLLRERSRPPPWLLPNRDVPASREGLGRAITDLLNASGQDSIHFPSSRFSSLSRPRLSRFRSRGNCAKV